MSSHELRARETSNREDHAVPAPPAHAPSPFRILHRNLRGRYAAAIVLATILGAAGAYAGWTSQQPQYRAEGLIYIRPNMPSPQDPAGMQVLPMLQGFVSLQVRMLESPAATSAAMQTEEWQKTGEGMSPEVIASFVARRTIVHEGDTQHLQIFFVDPSPEVAAAGVRALIEAYEKLTKEEAGKDESLAFVTGRADVLNAQLKNTDDQILRLSAAYGGVEGLGLRHQAAVTKAIAAEEELERVRSAIREQEAAISAPKSSGPKSPDQIAVENSAMADMLLQLELVEGQERLLAKSMGDSNDKLVALREEIQVRKKRIAAFVESWNRDSTTGTRATETAIERAKARLEGLKLEEARLVERLTPLQSESRKFGEDRVEIGRLRAESDDQRRRLDQMKAYKDELTSQRVGSGRIIVEDRGSLPTSPYRDRRRAMGAIGGVLGALAGVFVVLLFGLRDRRFRGSDDVGTSLARLRLLGLLPSLPSDLSDPKSGEIAAHCVHQVRTLLQIGHARDHGTCVCVTGPGVGSGKTTLSLSLGLSFGRSGSRTLLVDGDLTGRGLTWRVSQMLLARVRRVAAGASAEGAVAGRDVDSTSGSFLEPVVHGEAPAGRLELEELVSLLSRSVERLGLEAARRTGLINDVFALADLELPEEARASLVSRLTAIVGSSDIVAGASLDWIPPRTVELRPDSPRLDADAIRRGAYPTGIETVRLLPLRGLGDGGGVSFATIANILGSARSEFDIVVVDTGPLGGSVEAPIVAADADAVVFVVSPDDRRTDAERAVTQLEDVGARIAGVVFNRASPKDVLKASRAYSTADRGSAAK